MFQDNAFKDFGCAKGQQFFKWLEEVEKNIKIEEVPISKLIAIATTDYPISMDINGLKIFKDTCDNSKLLMKLPNEDRPICLGKSAIPTYFKKLKINGKGFYRVKDQDIDGLAMVLNILSTIEPNSHQCKVYIENDKIRAVHSNSFLIVSILGLLKKAEAIIRNQYCEVTFKSGYWSHENTAIMWYLNSMSLLVPYKNVLRSKHRPLDNVNFYVSMNISNVKYCRFIDFGLVDDNDKVISVGKFEIKDVDNFKLDLNQILSSFNDLVAEKSSELYTGLW